jgi:hypothetical protein
MTLFPYTTLFRSPDEARVTWTESVDAGILKAVTHNPFLSVRE